MSRSFHRENSLEKLLYTQGLRLPVRRPRFYSQILDFRSEPCTFGAARVEASPRWRSGRSQQVGDAQQVPRARVIIGVFDQIVVARATHAKAVAVITIAAKVLKRPVGISAIGHDGSQVAGNGRFELHRRFQPALVGHPHHQPGLVVLVNWKRVDFCRKYKIARHLRREKVPVVRAKAIMGSLPEVGFAGRVDDQPRAATFQVPSGWRIQPLKCRMKCGASECFVDQVSQHAFCADIIAQVIDSFPGSAEDASNDYIKAGSH
jgi:hypothetical protein